MGNVMSVSQAVTGQPGKRQQPESEAGDAGFIGILGGVCVQDSAQPQAIQDVVVADGAVVVQENGNGVTVGAAGASLGEAAFAAVSADAITTGIGTAVAAALPGNVPAGDAKAGATAPLSDAGLQAGNDQLPPVSGDGMAQTPEIQNLLTQAAQDAGLPDAVGTSGLEEQPGSNAGKEMSPAPETPVSYPADKAVQEAATEDEAASAADTYVDSRPQGKHTVKQKTPMEQPQQTSGEQSMEQSPERQGTGNVPQPAAAEKLFAGLSGAQVESVIAPGAEQSRKGAVLEPSVQDAPTAVPVAKAAAAEVMREAPQVKEAVRTAPVAQHDETAQVRKVGNDISINIARGSNEMRLSLKPEFLGEVTVKVQFDAHSLKLDMSTDNAYAKQMIESNLGVLKDALAQHGLDVGSVEVNVRDGADARGSSDFGRKDPQPTEHTGGSLEEAEVPAEQLALAGNGGGSGAVDFWA